MLIGFLRVARLIAVANIIPFAASALISIGGTATVDVAKGLTLEGDLAYVADGRSGLRIIDVSNPAWPVELGGTSTFEGYAKTVVVSEGYAYVADEFGSGAFGFHIFDVSDPTTPVEVAAVRPRGAEDIILDGTVAYLAAQYAGLAILDVSDPAVPTLIGELDIGYASGLALSNGRLYVSTHVGLKVIDVSDPTTPLVLGAIDTFDKAVAIAVVDNFAYVAEEWSGLRIIDVSDPSSPLQVAAVETPGPASDVTVVGPLAYVSGRGALRVIDVSDPLAPEALGAISTPGGAKAAVIREGIAYVASASGGLQVVDVSVPETPIQRSVFELGLRARGKDVAVAGGLAYLADTGKGLRILDVSDPAAPIEIGAISAFSWGEVIEVFDDVAYLADALYGLRIIDVSNPSSPILLSSISANSGAMALADGLVFLGHGYSHELEIIDVSNPNAPVKLGEVALSTGAMDVAVAGQYAYVATGEGLRIVDVSDPASPIEVGWLDTPNISQAVDVVGGVAYVGGLFGLWTVDVSDPAAPVRISAMERPEPRGITVVDDLAFTTGQYHLSVVDVSNPMMPRFLGAMDVLSEGGGVEVKNGLVYAASFPALHIVDFGSEYEAGVAIGIDIKPGSDPNSINLSDEGVIPVAILGSDSFDVASVDATTLVFGPNGAAPAHCHGPHVEDLDGDGFADLMAHYRTEETGIEYGTLVACLSGETLDGKAFSGCDAVRTVPDMDGDKLLDTEEATLGTNALNPDTDGDGFTDGNEVLVLRTDPLNAHDPTPAQTRRGRPGRRHRR